MTVFTWFRMAAWSSVSMRVYGQKTAPTTTSQEYFTLSNRLVLFFLCCFLRFLTAGWYRCCGEGCFTRRQCSQFAQYPGHHHCMSSSSYVKKSCSTYLTLKKGFKSMLLNTLYCLYNRVIQHLTKQFLQELQFPPLSCASQLQPSSQSLRSILKLWSVSSRYLNRERQIFNSSCQPQSLQVPS